MRKSIIVYACILAGAIAIGALQITGIYSYSAFVATLALGGLALVIFRKPVSAWLQAGAAGYPMMGLWRRSTPLIVVFYGLALLVMAVIAFRARLGR